MSPRSFRPRAVLTAWAPCEVAPHPVQAAPLLPRAGRLESGAGKMRKNFREFLVGGRFFEAVKIRCGQGVAERIELQADGENLFQVGGRGFALQTLVDPVLQLPLFGALHPGL